MEKLGAKTVNIDCDVLQADGGTRTLSITGSYIALRTAINKIFPAPKTSPLNDSVAAISVGILNGIPILDLCYEEDSKAEVDMNIVMTGSGKFVEIQGTGEKSTFTQYELNQMLTLAREGIEKLLNDNSLA
jgi:ribonuclease PH